MFVTDGQALFWKNMQNKQNVLWLWLYFFIISYVEVSKYNKHEPGK